MTPTSIYVLRFIVSSVEHCECTKAWAHDAKCVPELPHRAHPTLRGADAVKRHDTKSTFKLGCFTIRRAGTGGLPLFYKWKYVEEMWEQG